MADNTPQNGTAVIATDEVTSLNGATVSAVQVQRVKMVFGDDSIARDVSNAFPMPVEISPGNKTPVVISAVAAVSSTTEALFALSIYRAGVTSTGNQYNVATGKTLRLTAIQFGSRFATMSATATFASARFNLRAIPAGGGTTMTTANSQIVYGDSKVSSSASPTPNSDLAIPDGLDFPGNYAIGVSHIDSAATLLLDILLVGYEY